MCSANFAQQGKAI